MTKDNQVKQKKTLKRVASASFIGNFVEWFDYAAYGFLATVIAVVFFPQSDPLTALMAAYAIFAISFILRPLGGIFWGHVGDKFGRKNALSWSIILMTLATVCIALLPSYQSIGIFAPILLLVFRMIQGFSASGEYAGAANFLAEYAPKEKRGLYTSLVPASTAAGLLLGSVMAAAMFAFMSEAFLHEYGWRIPFLLAAPLGLIGYYIRVKLEDTPEFLEHQKTGQKENFPIKALFSQYRPALFKAFAVASLNATAFYLIFNYMPNYLATELGVNKTQAFISGSISLLFYIAVVFAMGKYSDRIGRKKMLLWASLSFIALTIPLFYLLSTASFVEMVMIQLVFCTLLAMNDGSLPVYLTEQFPIQVRYTGFAFSFNTANALLGGTVPFVATWLIQQTGNTLAPSVLLIVVAIFASMALLQKKSHRLVSAKA
ncbi:MFS transporter [Acinetobacter baumannii]|nr:MULTISPECIES: MFS transporter [Acinetobacter]KAB1608551.1 MHS family MFS transporter [Acinetobacter baumannii]MBO0651171.1 MFS transporter [Acinetobacter baumannii]MCQ1096026.1 MFS transporter [Acinetobacter baumannii]MCT9479934.1 MFS transporter [Acinetobacter baumannii]MCU4483851.1 MFS transporter [Acinetobacter ursingii]